MFGGGPVDGLNPRGYSTLQLCVLPVAGYRPPVAAPSHSGATNCGVSNSRDIGGVERNPFVLCLCWPDLASLTVFLPQCFPLLSQRRCY